MKYAVEIGSGGREIVRTKFGSGLRKFNAGGGIYRHTDSVINSQAYFYFLKIKKID
jgi:hypothetical protein